MLLGIIVGYPPVQIGPLLGSRGPQAREQKLAEQPVHLVGRALIAAARAGRQEELLLIGQQQQGVGIGDRQHSAATGGIESG